LDALADAIASRVAARLQNGRDPAAADSDHLLTLPQAADRLGVTRGWLARHAARLPFTRKLSHKTLRFSNSGITRWLARRGS